MQLQNEIILPKNPVFYSKFATFLKIPPTKRPGAHFRVPVYAGIQELADSSVVLRFMVDVQEDNFFVARRRLNREIKILFDENHIEIPFNQLDVHTVWFFKTAFRKNLPGSRLF